MSTLSGRTGSNLELDLDGGFGGGVVIRGDNEDAEDEEEEEDDERLMDGDDVGRFCSFMAEDARLGMGGEDFDFGACTPQCLYRVDELVVCQKRRGSVKHAIKKDEETHTGVVHDGRGGVSTVRE